MIVNPDPVQINSEEINKEYEAIEDILKRERFSNQEIKEHILKIGYELERIFRKSGNDEFVSEISELILRTLKKRGLGHLRTTVYNWFTDFPQWKADYSSRRSVQDGTELPEHFSIALEQANHAYKVLQREFNINTISQIPEQFEPKVKRQIANLYDLHDSVTDRFKKLYEEKGWSTVEDNWDPLTESERLQRSERNHIKKPEPIEDADNPALLGAMEFDEEWHKVIQKLREYPVQDRAKSIRMGEALREFKGWFRSYSDHKHRDDSFGWMKIVLGLEETSIHHMSNLTRSADIYGKLRHITKEQISDNKDKILEFNYRLMKKIPGLIELSMWFHEEVLPYRKELTNATSPKLQASA